MNFWLPTRPYTLIDAINRKAVNEYLEKYVVLTPNVDYQGHYVTVEFDVSQKGWETKYGRHLIARGDFEECVLAARADYDRGAVGAVVVVYDVPPKD